MINDFNETEKVKMIAIGCDHGGFELKKEVIKYFEENNITYKDFGTDSLDSCDYPVFAKLVGDSVSSGECEKGILICGTGIGISIAANKIKGIRAAVCSDYFSAKYTRLHNDANVLCFGGRVVGAGLALELVDVFLNTEYEGGARHERRLQLIREIENNN